MARFLDDRQVGKAIREVVAGDEPRCAVAFWGDEAANSLFGTKKRARTARIVCDLTMGGTNPAELVLLGAPDNPNLRHVPGLHAKIYLSSAGLIVASANASRRGIGFVEPPALVECGSFHFGGGQAARDAARWFERLWDRSEQVDGNALATAQRAWARRSRHGAPSPTGRVAPPSLLHRIAADPVAFRGVGVAFTTGEATRKDVENASRTAIAADDHAIRRKLSDADRELLRTWPPGDLFTNWSDAEANAWPATFLSVHRGSRGGLGYWPYERLDDARVGPDECYVFATRSPTTRSLLGIKAPPREAARADAALLGRIFDLLDREAETGEHVGHRLCESPLHLARLLEIIGETV